MECPYDTSMHWDITERKSIMYFFNACLYMCGKCKKPVAFVSIKCRAKNNHCGTIAHKIGTSATSLLRCMKDNIEPWNLMELNIWKSWTWLLIFISYCIHYGNMNQNIFAFPLRQGTASLEDSYFVSEGYKNTDALQINAD